MAKLGFKDMIMKYLKKDEDKIKEDAPANATGTAVAGTGDDSSTVVVKKKKDQQKKLMTRMGITEAINKAIPDLEYPKDEIRERVNQLKTSALGEAFTSQQIRQAYGIANDPRYKGGNYDGAVKAIEKIAKGLSKHPDVANALKRANEETITEFKKMVVTIADPVKRAKAMDDIKRFGKNTGFRIDKMSDGKSFRIDGKGADLNKFAIDMKNYYGAEIKAESIEEAFTKKDFQKLETTNDHTEAAKKLINMFGTNQEKKTMADIERRHEKIGYISGTDYKMRQIMVNKYYSRLK